MVIEPEAVGCMFVKRVAPTCVRSADSYALMSNLLGPERNPSARSGVSDRNDDAQNWHFSVAANQIDSMRRRVGPKQENGGR